MQILDTITTTFQKGLDLPPCSPLTGVWGKCKTIVSQLKWNSLLQKCMLKIDSMETGNPYVSFTIYLYPS